MSVSLSVANSWIGSFLSEKSGIGLDHEIVSQLASSILHYQTLKSLVRERFDSGVRFCGWTTNGSRGFTEVSSGNIYLGKSGAEAVTLGYECVNSTNKKIYNKIGIKFAFLETSEENREKFAEEILRVEARAMYIKCRLVSEMHLSGIVKEHYLEIFRNPVLSEEDKIDALAGKMKEKGLVQFTKPAFEFYKNERYDEFVLYYREQIRLGKIQ